MPESPNPFADLPEQDADPGEWDPQPRRFVSQSEREAATRPPPPAPPPPTSAAPTGAAPAEPGRDPRRYFVGAGSVGQAPPPRAGVDAPAPPGPPPPVIP